MAAPQSTSAWRSRDVLRVTGLVALVYLALRLLWDGQEILFVAFVGVLFGLALSAAVDRAERRRIPRAVAAPIILLLILGALVGFAAFAAPQVSRQFREVKDQVPKVVGKARGWVETKVGGMTQLLSDSAARTRSDSLGVSTHASPAASTGRRDSSRVAPGDSTGDDSTPDSLPQGGPETKPATPSGSPAGKVDVKQLTPQAGTVGRAFFRFFSSTLSAIGAVILILFMSLFIAIDPGLYQRGLTHLVPHRNRPRAKEVLHSISVTLRQWLVTQLIAMVVIGVATGLALWIIGVRGAIALGVIAGLLEFVPFVGPIAAAVPAVAMGLLDSPEKGIYAALACLVIQQAENHLLIPLLMKDSLDLPPVLTILSQALMAAVFGFLGLLVAVPLLAMVMVVVKLLYVADVVGDRVAGEERA